MMMFVVVGAGSLGQAFGGLLARAGAPVTLLATPRSANRLRASGAIRLRGAVDALVSLDGSGLVLTTEAADVPDGAVVVFTTKGQDLLAAIDSLRSAAGERIGWACGVQNGIVKDELLAAAFGADRVVGAATILGAQRQADDSVSVTSLGRTYLGELDGRVSERVQTAADTFWSAGIPTEARDDIQRVLWSKACNATGVFGVTVLTRVSNDRLFSDPHLMRAYLALVRETAAVAAVCGVQVGDYAGFPPIRTFVETDEQVTIDQLRPPVSPASPSYASMTSDLLAGRPLEVEAVFGDIVQRAERSAVPVPCLRLVRDLIRGVDPGRSGSARSAE
jgi:2-dehydropantoate 2-reductase